MSGLSRYDRLLHALEEAGDRGLRHDQVRAAGGKSWKEIVEQLEADGAILHRDRGQHATLAGFFRLIMRAAPPAVPAPVTAAGQDRLLDSPSSPAVAIDVDLGPAIPASSNPAFDLLRLLEPKPGESAQLQFRAGSEESFDRMAAELTSLGRVQVLDVDHDDDTVFRSAQVTLPNRVTVVVLGPTMVREAVL